LGTQGLFFYEAEVIAAERRHFGLKTKAGGLDGRNAAPVERKIVKTVGRQLKGRVATPDLHGWFDQQLRERHYLGPRRWVGDYLTKVVERGGQAVVLLVWRLANDAPQILQTSPSNIALVQTTNP
jgi:hypothetical protein